MAAVAPPSQRWLYGPGPDLLLGCGLGYMAVFAALVLAGAEIRALLPLALLPLVSVFAGTPHYGATLLRVYEKGSERRAYAVFTVWLTLLVWALFVAGLYQAALGSFLLSLYLTWSPWHYTGQNYGVALIFLRRRGVDVTPDVKRPLYVSFVLSYLLTFLAIHGAAYSVDYAPIDSYAGSTYAFHRLAIPAPYWVYAWALLGVGYLAAGGLAVKRLLARATLSDLAPTLCVAATQLLWFSLPPLGRELGLLQGLDPFRPDSAAFLFTWVAAGHALQYLWVTSYYFGVRERRARWRWYARCVCGGSAIWSLPVVAYTWTGLAGSRLGGVATGEDAAVLLAAMVNIHHFMLDGAIWKLRDGRVARALIRREEAPALPDPAEPMRRRWLAPVLLTAGALWTLTTIGSLLERERRFEPAIARGDLASAEASLRRLSWMRRDALQDYHGLASASEKLGDSERALRAIDGAIGRHDQPASHHAKATYLAQLGRPEEAARAWEAGLGRAPDDARMLYGLGRLRLEEGRLAEARELLERAQARSPEDRRIGLTLERLREAAGTAPPAGGGV